MEERKVYKIPKYIDEDPKALGLIPVDVLFVFVIVAMPLIWLLDILKGVLLSLLISFLYYRSVKNKGRGYYKIILYNLGLMEIDGAFPPTEKEIRK